MNKKITLFINGIWAVLTALHESGTIDIIPFEENIGKWVKWIVAVAIISINALYFQKEDK